MSLVTGINRGLNFGIVPDKRPLPEGWKYIECGNDWLMCSSPDGALFFAGKEKLYPAVIVERPKFGMSSTLPIDYP